MHSSSCLYIHILDELSLNANLHLTGIARYAERAVVGQCLM